MDVNIKIFLMLLAALGASVLLYLGMVKVPCKWKLDKEKESKARGLAGFAAAFLGYSLLLNVDGWFTCLVLIAYICGALYGVFGVIVLVLNDRFGGRRGRELVSLVMKVDIAYFVLGLGIGGVGIKLIPAEFIIWRYIFVIFGLSFAILGVKLWKLREKLDYPSSEARNIKIPEIKK